MSLLERFQVSLATQQVEEDLLSGMLSNIVKPRSQVRKCVLSREIKTEEHYVRSLVEDASDRAERFLACRIPNLQLYNLLVQLDNKVTEFNSDGDLMLDLKLFVHHT